MNIITKSVDEIQNIYQRVIGEIKDKKEKEIIHCLFQDLSDKLLDNIKEEELKNELCFYFFGLSLLISGVGIISGSESDITIIMGAVSLSLGFYLIYVGGKADD